MQVSKNQPQMSIPEFYSGKSVFITGGMGFVGKVLVEKLLRSCPGIDNIYLLCRSKKGKNINERLEEITSSPAFDLLREQNPQPLNKIILIEGDVAMLELGISKTDQEILKDKVSVVIHSAATISFTEPLKIAVNTNLRAMRELLNFCKQMKDLKSFVHISTAYTNWFELNVKEEIYSTEYDPHYVMDMCDRHSDAEINKMTSKLLGKHVNTYTFTKALAENLLKQESKNLPLAIVRPSMISASLSEPKVGWIDTLSAASTYVYLIGSGAYRSTQISSVPVPCDIIPVDIVANMSVAAAWKAGTVSAKTEYPLIYHCTSGAVNPLKWNEFLYWSRDAGRNYPLESVHWYPKIRMHSTRIGEEIDTFFTHLMPAYLIDFAARLAGKKPRAVKSQKAIKRTYDASRFASAVPYKFQASNFNNILLSMTETDKKQFNIDPKTINWRQYMQDYFLGIKKYSLKENPVDLSLAKTRLARLKAANYLMLATMASFSVILLGKVGQKLMTKQKSTGSIQKISSFEIYDGNGVGYA